MNLNFLKTSSLISKDQKENIICTLDDVRGDILGPPHGTTPAAVIANKNLHAVCKRNSSYLFYYYIHVYEVCIPSITNLEPLAFIATL